MALSQCAALMGDVPHWRARSGPGPLGRQRLQGGTEGGCHLHTPLRSQLVTQCTNNYHVDGVESGDTPSGCLFTVFFKLFE